MGRRTPIDDTCSACGQVITSFQVRSRAGFSTVEAWHHATENAACPEPLYPVV